MAKNISNLPLNDRPYEKMELLGAEYLTNSELLAIIIKTGTKENNCLQIAQNILKRKDHNMYYISDFEYLNSLSIEELKTFDGIGRVKAIQIKAVLELAKRINEMYKLKKAKVLSPKDVYDILSQSYIGMKQECLKTLLLNKNNNVISIVKNAIGNSDRIQIGLKEIFSEPLKQMASSIILVHNHPSGTLLPSKADIDLTKKVIECSEILGIQVLDHIIITNDGYISLKEKHYI